MRKLTTLQIIHRLEESGIQVDDGCFFDKRTNDWLPITLIQAGWISLKSIINNE